MTVPSKVPYISDLLIEKGQLFMAITETWLQNHKEAELHIGGYDFYHCDRKRVKKSSRGRFSGGVGCYVRQDLGCTMEVAVKYSNGVVELLGLYSKERNIYLAVIYRQPDDPAGGYRSTETEFKLALDQLQKSLSRLSTPAPNVIFCGDFNIRHASWPDGSSSEKSPSTQDKLLECLSKFTNEHFLSQYITTPTHVKGNVLDLVFTNNSYIVHSYSTLKPLLSTSDHYVVEVNTPLVCDNGEEEEKPAYASPFDNLNFFSNDIEWDKISEEITTQTDNQEFTSLAPDEKLARFLKILADICFKYIPLKKSSKKCSTKIPRDRRILMRKRRKLSIQMESNSSIVKKEKIREKLIKIELLLQASHADARDRKEKLAIKAIKTNPRFFYSYAKQYSVVKSKIGPLLNDRNEYTKSSYEMANILSRQYSAVYSTPRANIWSNESDDTIPTISDIFFTEEDIKDAIDELRNNSASGPDGIAAIFLKKCKISIAKPLYSLWRDCLDHGITPSKLKIGHIIPIHKGGHHGVASNYRPIALTSQLIKVFEKVIRTKIVDFMEENDLFNQSQHGFRAGRSCLSQLLDHYDKILSLLEKGLNVDSIYLDFAKAFDKVDHNIVLNKLSLLGVRGKLLQWIKSFLASRTQKVVVNGVLSEECAVISGVPQGSVIGPLLFLILLGDIDSNIAASFLSSFADDTRLTIGLSGVTQASALQTDLEAVYQWAEENNMTFNDLKFEVLRYGRDATLKLTTSYTSPNGSIIDTKEHVRDLGVTMSSNGNFSEHIRKICQSARNMCAWILRTFADRSHDLMLTTWKQLVLPILDYGSQLWSPSKKGDIQQIEDVQRCFTRKISIRGRNGYWERLRSLRLYSLERRRERYRIIYAWKILENLVPNLSNDENKIRSKCSFRFGRLCVVPSVSKTSSHRLQSLREGSFCVNGPQLFNILPQDIRNLTNVGIPTFKKKLDEFLATIADEPQSPGYTASRRADSNSLLHMMPASSNYAN